MSYTHRFTVERTVQELVSVLGPQLILIQILSNKKSRESLGDTTSFVLIWSAVILSLAYWFCLFSLGETKVEGLAIATIGSLCLTVVLFAIWDENRRNSERKIDEIDSEIRIIALICPNLFLCIALTVGNFLVDSSQAFMCSSKSLMAVVLCTLLAFSLFYAVKRIKDNPIILRIPFSVPRNSLKYSGVLLIFSYITFEIFSIGQKGFVTDFKIVMCYFDCAANHLKCA